MPNGSEIIEIERPNKMLKNKYGFFSDDGKEFVITNSYTPRPWINVISNGDYSMIVSQTGGGFSFRGNAEQNRITRLYQDIVKDNWGKYFYIRDKQSGAFWSAALNPVKKDAESYTVRHGMGYSVFTRATEGVESTLTVFVSRDKPMEYMLLTLKNLTDRPRELDVTGYFEWALGIAYDTHREFQRLFYDLGYDAKLHAVVANKCLWGFPDSKGRYNNDDYPYTAFFACSEEPSSFDADKETFIGMYRDEADPAAMHCDKLACGSGRYVDPVAALRADVSLAPKTSKTICFAVGLAQKQEEDYRSLAALTRTDIASDELRKVKAFWTELCDKEHVETPDPAFDVMTNYWCKYQALSCRMWAKAAYYQISGGIGFRDQLQDSLVALETDPSLTEKQILLHATKQFSQGDVLHWWLTYNGAGPRTSCSDDFLWLPFATLCYMEETGDRRILDKQASWLDGGSADIYDHCKAAINHSFEMFGERGIPLMGAHDWNDGLSAVGHGMKGESFWVAEFLYYIITRFAPVAVERGDAAFGRLLADKAKQLKTDFNTHGWDGEWFLQATNDLGEKLGSKDSSEGKIFLNPQLWAVISDITTNERKQRAMDSVEKYLLKDFGALLLAPEYCSPDSEVGYITRYAPGLRENGGVYTHAATWAVWAEALMGRADMAYKAYKGICPPNRGKDIDVFKSEPYVLPGNSDGPISPYFGKGGWSWYSGSAQWLHRVAVNWILGVRATYDGLTVDPCIPSDWQGYHYRRAFRNAVYDITVKRTGQRRVTVDGKAAKFGKPLPDFRQGEHKIEVEIE